MGSADIIALTEDSLARFDDRDTHQFSEAVSIPIIDFFKDWENEPLDSSVSVPRHVRSETGCAYLTLDLAAAWSCARYYVSDPIWYKRSFLPLRKR